MEFQREIFPFVKPNRTVFSKLYGHRFLILKMSTMSKNASPITICRSEMSRLVTCLDYKHQQAVLFWLFNKAH